ncbi:MAG: D-amino acid dehydrogenase [Zoogloeaceae bacterium]|jgi:D-amino-acid dehydrogenase|nr:D-amino acid dehydrogenase [Zoogloeaceae bacterium]
MKILVLGAGVIGVTSAWYLRQAGHEVTVIERRAAVAEETSHANGGQISVSHAEPWANPRALPQMLAWLGREDAPLLFRLRPYDLPLIKWSLAFLGNCLPARAHANTRAIVHLALESRKRLQILRQQLSAADGADFNFAYDGLQKGILHLYTDRQSFSHAIRAARLMRRYGLAREPIDAQTCVDIEPALAPVRERLVGGDYTPADESGDACRFTQALAARAAAAGVEFCFNAPITRLDLRGRQVEGVILRDGRRFQAEASVLALGSYSAPFLRPYGIRLPVYPAKGYSATLNLEPDAPAPSVSLTDDSRKLVFSRLGNRLRIAGTAEFNGYNLALNLSRCQALLTRARELFPELRFFGDPQFWCGLRPATPSNVPLIGQGKLAGLWLNTGHGTLGWTLACGSAAALAALIAGQHPGVDFPFLEFKGQKKDTLSFRQRMARS